MSTALNDLDRLLLDRWHDAVGIRDGLRDLEEKLQTRFESACAQMEPWLEERGYSLFEVGSRYADLSIVKESWMKKKDEARIWILMGAVLPYGFRKVTEDHPYVWVVSKGLAKDEQEAFGAQLAERLKHRPEKWLNESCRSGWPAGMNLTDFGDKERLELAQSEETLKTFMKAHLEPILALGLEVDSTLEAIRSAGAKAR